MNRHVCTANRCHACPDMGGDIMPGCDGVAAKGFMWACTCKSTPRSKSSEDRIEVLERQVAELTKLAAATP